MRLYYAPGACLLAVPIALREIGATDNVAVEVTKHSTADGADFHDYRVADAYAFTIVNSANFLALPLTPYPHRKTCLTRESARPRVQEALRAEGLVK